MAVGTSTFDRQLEGRGGPKHRFRPLWLAWLRPETCFAAVDGVSWPVHETQHDRTLAGLQDERDAAQWFATVVLRGGVVDPDIPVRSPSLRRIARDRLASLTKRFNGDFMGELEATSAADRRDQTPGWCDTLDKLQAGAVFRTMMGDLKDIRSHGIYPS